MKEKHIVLLILVLAIALTSVPVSASNKVLNPSFEDGPGGFNGATYWTQTGTDGYSKWSSLHTVGSYCCRLYTPYNCGGTTTTIYQSVDFTGGSYLTFDWGAQRGSGTTTGQMRSVLIDSTEVWYNTDRDSFDISQSASISVSAYTGVHTLTFKDTTSYWSDNFFIDNVQLDTPDGPTFTYNPASGTAPLTVSFTMSSAFHSTNSWDFGDGFWAYDNLYPTHVYNNPGIYNVTLYDGTGSPPTYTHVSHNVTVSAYPSMSTYQISSRDHLTGDWIPTNLYCYSNSNRTALYSNVNTSLVGGVQMGTFYNLTTNWRYYYSAYVNSSYQWTNWSEVAGQQSGIQIPMYRITEPTIPIPTSTPDANSYLLLVYVKDDSDSSYISSGVEVIRVLTDTRLFQRSNPPTQNYASISGLYGNEYYDVYVTSPGYYPSDRIRITKGQLTEMMDIRLSRDPNIFGQDTYNISFRAIDNYGSYITTSTFKVTVTDEIRGFTWGAYYSQNGIAVSHILNGTYHASIEFIHGDYTPTGYAYFVSNADKYVTFECYSNSVIPVTPIATYTPVITPSWSGGGGQPGNLTEGVLNFFMVLFGVNALTAGILAALVLCLIVGAASAHFAGAIGFMMGCVVAFVACVVMGLIPIWVLIAIIVIIVFVWFLYPMISNGGE